MARTPIAYRYVRGVRKMRGKRLMKGRTWMLKGDRRHFTYIYRSGKRIKAWRYPGDSQWYTTGGWKKV